MDLLFKSQESNLINRRYEYVFLLISGLFLSTLVIINILGLSRFVDLSLTWGEWKIPMRIPFGVLPYPITFLCTDLISEFYGKRRANLVVGVGFLVNIWILLILWLGGILPPEISLDAQTHLPTSTHPDFSFFQIRLFTIGGIFGSMLAYLVAQFLDVYLFHFWKDLTRGKHLWLRNNGSTLISQFFDTLIVITVAYLFTNAIPVNTEQKIIPQLFTFIISIYTFKAIFTLLDTFPFYLTVFYLRRYFGLTPKKEAPRHKLLPSISIKSYHH